MSVNFNAWRFTKGKSKDAPHYKASFKDASGQYHDIASIWVREKKEPNEDGVKEKYLGIAIDEDGLMDFAGNRPEKKEANYIDPDTLPF